MRLPERQQKITELFKSVLGVPWRLRPNVARNHEDADLEAGDIPTMVATAPIVPEDELPPRVEAQGRDVEIVHPTGRGARELRVHRRVSRLRAC